MPGPGSVKLLAIQVGQSGFTSDDLIRPDTGGSIHFVFRKAFIPRGVLIRSCCLFTVTIPSQRCREQLTCCPVSLRLTWSELNQRSGLSRVKKFAPTLGAQ